VPLHLYRLRPVLAISFGEMLVADEHVLTLRARSHAMAVGLRLSGADADRLARCLLAERESGAGCGWQIGPVEPTPLQSPWLAVPLDLDAAAQQVHVREQAAGRYVCIEARGAAAGSTFLVELWITREQGAALGRQIEQVCSQHGERQREWGGPDAGGSGEGTGDGECP